MDEERSQPFPASESAMQNEPPALDETEAQAASPIGGNVDASDEPKPKKRKEKAPATVSRDPGKSLLPYTRVQKILKADKELPMVQREAGFLISIAAEEFIKRISRDSHRIAAREKRATVQHRDIATAVRKQDEYTFLEELIPWQEVEASARRKPRALRDEEESQPRSTTMLDKFVAGAKKNTGSITEDGPDEDIVMNEDGTMTMDSRTS